MKNIKLVTTGYMKHATAPSHIATAGSSMCTLSSPVDTTGSPFADFSHDSNIRWRVHMIFSLSYKGRLNLHLHTLRLNTGFFPVPVQLDIEGNILIKFPNKSAQWSYSLKRRACLPTRLPMKHFTKSEPGTKQPNCQRTRCFFFFVFFFQRLHS